MTLIKYLLKRFLPIFFGSLAFLSFALSLVDLLINLWQYVLQEVPFLDILHICALYVPKAISFSAPLAILFTTAYTLSSLYANNELTAIFSSGVSLIQFTMPILIFALLASIVSFFFEDRIVVPTLRDKVEAQKLALNEKTSYDNNRLVVLSKGGNIIYRCDNYNDAEKRLINIDIIVRNDDKTLDRIIQAEYAYWNDESWDLVNPHTYINTDNGLVFSNGTDFISTEHPDTFKSFEVSVDEVNIKDAKAYIDKLKRTGLPYAEESAQYQEKFSFPFVLFISVFLSIGLSGKSKKNVLLVSLALCISAAVLFYVFQMVTVLMAKFGYLSPVAGSWLPIFTFVTMSIVLLRFTRT